MQNTGNKVFLGVGWVGGGGGWEESMNQFNLTKRRTNDKETSLLISQIEGTEIAVARTKILGISQDDERKC